MAFQVMTDRPTRGARAGRGRIDFHASRTIGDVPTTEVSTETGVMLVSTPEATALDLIRYSGSCGGLGNVATVLGEMAERMRPSLLHDVARQRKTPEIQRLGFLLDEAGHPRLADPLLRVLASRRVRSIMLDPAEHAAEIAAVDPWRIIPNAVVEADS
jgi:predicted transcriptional regulator of viral defense system